MPTPPGAALAMEAEPLKPYTTFKIGGPARYFVRAAALDDFRGAIHLARTHSLPLFVLGGGSNVLVSDRGFGGVVIHPECQGVAILQEDAQTAMLEVKAAEVWDNLVQYAVDRGLWGIENLSHIPGQSGAALVQNIGAYGQQISDVVESVRVMGISTGMVRDLTAAECEFEYRQSTFNTRERGRLIILAVMLRLSKIARPQLAYPDVRKYFAERGVAQPSLREIREAIITIRDRKFPFPREERGGNAGSFFKNLTLRKNDYQRLCGNVATNFPPEVLRRLEELRHRFPSADRVKIPTAFLIEICGLKGYGVGGAQVNETQPLVLLNLGGATAKDVLALARHIRQIVLARTGMLIAIEPELVGFTPDEIAHFNNLDES